MGTIHIDGSAIYGFPDCLRCAYIPERGIPHGGRHR